jgi:hypothetical protein
MMPTGRLNTCALTSPPGGVLRGDRGDDLAPQVGPVVERQQGVGDATVGRAGHAVEQLEIAHAGIARDGDGLHLAAAGVGHAQGDLAQFRLLGGHGRYRRTVAGLVQDVARGAEARGAGQHGLLDDGPHGRAVGLGGRLQADRPLAHHEHAQRRVR